MTVVPLNYPWQNVQCCQGVLAKSPWLKKGFRKKIGVLKIWGLKTPKKGLKGVLKWKKGDLKSYIQ